MAGGNDEGPHVCLDKRVRQQDLLKAAELAIAENPENAPSGDVDAARRLGVDTSSSREIVGAVLTGKKWMPGQKLRVRHLDGDPQIHAKVEHYAKTWEQFANLQFVFIREGDAEIRISYPLDGNSWSHIGTDALTIPRDQHTMHYGWLRPTTPDEEYRRVVVHEFGHAIGMIHEQSQPMNTIKWDKAAVYRSYEQQGWSRERVDSNVFAKYDVMLTQFSAYDPHSIMHYPV